MPSLVVELGERSYNIEIGQGLLSRSDLWTPFCEGENVLILTNQIVEPLYLQTIVEALPDKKVFTYVLPDGEVEKNLDNFAEILNFLLEKQFRRNDTLIALGGGVIGDLGGFVAASYQRGMGFLQMPTTLLAQVDSSVGGKTAVNHSLGKNMIGAFYQPKLVVIDTLTLKTLPDREFTSGLAEVAKYALLGEKELTALIQQQADKIIQREQSILSQLIYFSCQMKAKIVAADEKESGNRALLNLGHTFGHAIEKMSEYKRYFHGEAVAIGMHMALNLSRLKEMVSEQAVAQKKLLLDCLNLPKRLPKDYSAEALIEVMKLDKKNLSSKFRLILPKDEGCVIVEEDELELIQTAISLQYEES